MTYVDDVAALARKDLLLELRAKETLPAMLLFVALGACDLPLRVASRHRAQRGARPSLGRRSSSRRCSVSRALSSPSGSRGCSTRSCSRRAIAARSGSASRSPSSSFLVCAEIVALPAFGVFFSAVDGRTVAAVALADVGICTVGTLFGAMAVAGRARELLLPLLFLPMAIPIVVGGVGGYLWFLALYDTIFALLAWAAFEYVVAEA